MFGFGYHGNKQCAGSHGNMQQFLKNDKWSLRLQSKDDPIYWILGKNIIKAFSESGELIIDHSYKLQEN